jgi:nucleoid-associated protein YgaU
MPDTFTIEEDLDSGALSVTLQGPDLPHALPRSFAAFESGGSVESEDIYLQGRKRPIMQVKQARERPLVVKGAFRDHLFVQSGGDEGVEHARAMRDALERIRNRCNQVRITWAGERRLGLLSDAKFGEESRHDIPYELTFKIGVGVLDTADAPTPDGSRAARAATDTVTALRAIVAERRAALDAAAKLLRAREIVETIRSDLALVDSTFARLESEATSLDSAAPGAMQNAAARFYTLGESAQNAVNAAALSLAVSLAADAGADTADSRAAWFAFQHESNDVFGAMAIEVQQLRAAARSRIRRTVRLYTIRAGDTLESIARSQLGDPARARDLGLAPADLRPGRVIRIPEAA